MAPNTDAQVRHIDDHFNEDIMAHGEQFDEAIMMEGIETLADLAFQNAEKHGFWDGTPIPDIPVETRASKIALMHSELSEMLEGVRKPGPDSHCPEFTSEEVELADLFIRGGDYAKARGLRLAEAILAKMKFNATRPYKHGKTI